MDKLVHNHIQQYKYRLRRIDDGQIIWTDDHVSQLEPLYKQDRDKYVKILDSIVCDDAASSDTRMAAYNLYNLVWFTESNKSDITRRIRKSFQRVMNGGANELRDDMLCRMQKFCTGPADELLLEAHEILKRENGVMLHIISKILRNLNLHKDIPKSRDMLYRNFVSWIDDGIPFEKRLTYYKTDSDRKNFLFGQLDDVVQTGDMDTVVEIVEYLFRSKYTFDENRYNMTSYLQHVPEIWNRLSGDVQKYG